MSGQVDLNAENNTVPVPTIRVLLGSEGLVIYQQHLGAIQPDLGTAYLEIRHSTLGTGAGYAAHSTAQRAKHAQHTLKLGPSG